MVLLQDMFEIYRQLAAMGSKPSRTLIQHLINGVAVYLEAHHLCMEMRGVRETAPMTRTTVWRDYYAEDATLGSEFFTACGLQRNER